MILETERLTLRPWRISDAESLFEYAQDPQVGPNAGWPPHKDIKESREVIRNVLCGAECYAICEKGTDKAIGSVELKLNGHTDMTERDDECELGYCLGRKYWGRGYMPEAVRELLRRAFAELGMRAVWCGYYEGNMRSKRVQEKVGFAYHHTSYDLPVPLMHETRTGYANLMTKEQWLNGLKIMRLAECMELAEHAVKWFASKWGIPEEAYRESIAASREAVVPSWYLCMDGDRIIAGMGVIENDFHDRKDLAPNVCAVFTEEGYRRLGIARRMLQTVCDDMTAHGIETLYLLTGHTGLYERYGWEYLCDAQGDGEDKPSRVYVHHQKGTR